MKKRILSLLAIVAMLSSMLVMNVNADMVLKENYDAYSNEDDPLTTTSFHQYSGATGIAFDNGAVKIYNDENTSPVFDLRTGTSNQDYVLKFDMKQNQTFIVGGYLYRGDYRFWNYSLSCPEPNVWYTHLFIVKKDAGGAQKAYYYRKLQADPASSFVQVGSTLPSETNSGTAGLRFNFSDPATGDPTRNDGYTLWINNVEVHTGMYFAEKTFSAVENDVPTGSDPVLTEISSLSEIPAGTDEIKASLDVYNANISEGDITAVIGVTPVLVSFDASGKMLDCGLTTASIKAMDNESNAFSVTCPYNSNVSYMQLLMWDSIESMQVIFEPIELR